MAAADPFKALDDLEKAGQRIIAERDELLAALKNLRHHIVFDDEGDLTEPEFDAMLEEADAAILRAEGDL